MSTDVGLGPAKALFHRKEKEQCYRSYVFVGKFSSFIVMLFIFMLQRKRSHTHTIENKTRIDNEIQLLERSLFRLLPLSISDSEINPKCNTLCIVNFVSFLFQ